jgi:hypothetical protein
MSVDISEIVNKIAKLPKGALLRTVDTTQPSSKKEFDEAFYVKLGPTPAFPRG